MKKFLVLCAALLMASLAFAVPVQIGSLKVDVSTDPPTIPIGKANLIIFIQDSSGKPLEGAEVRATAAMPGMNMGEKEQAARPGDKPGVYVVPAVFSMAGLYEATITVNGEKGEVQLRTGQSTAKDKSFPWGILVVGIGLACLAIYVIHRVRKTGQKLDLKSLFNRQAAVSLLLLGGALFIVIYAVNNWRRPGSMTPIESQAMEMNTPAPDGVLPVVLAKAERKVFSQTVTYTGQAVGFVQQDVVARVSGTIVSMPVYVGDKVSKGQVLARLDTSQIDPEVSMRGAQVDRATRGVGVAALEHQMAENEVSQAKAEMEMAKGELAEAESMLKAAEEGRNSAASDLQEAQAEVSGMESDLMGAVAERDYMLAELGRMQELYSKGAATKDELQKSKSEADKAQAMVQQAESRIRQSQAAAANARSMQRKVEAEISVAKRKVQTAQAAVKAKLAMQRTAVSGASAAKARIGQERAMVNEAAAGLKGAATQKGYSVLTSITEGVVTERLISPGQFISPGQAVLKVAQVSPIRLQANVPEAVLSQIELGDEVQVFARKGDGKAMSLRVTSVAPSVDPTVRTGVVEAISENTEAAFKPGQFVSMRITLGGSAERTVIPSGAVFSSSTTAKGVLSTGEKKLVWVAEPSLNGEYDVKLREVTVVGRSGSESAVTGIEPGAMVIVGPPMGLKEGVRVIASDSAKTSESGLTVSVTERGYEPASITVPADKPVTITFVRKVDPSCGDILVFPSLNIRKELPHNKPVKVDLPAMKPGEVKFACGMDMYIGKVVVK
jgi:RND family efflux transporter MFP subunit